MMIKTLSQILIDYHVARFKALEMRYALLREHDLIAVTRYLAGSLSHRTTLLSWQNRIDECSKLLDINVALSASLNQLVRDVMQDFKDEELEQEARLDVEIGQTPLMRLKEKLSNFEASTKRMSTFGLELKNISFYLSSQLTEKTDAFFWHARLDEVQRQMNAIPDEHEGKKALLILCEEGGSILPKQGLVCRALERARKKYGLNFEKYSELIEAHHRLLEAFATQLPQNHALQPAVDYLKENLTIRTTQQSWRNRCREVQSLVDRDNSSWMKEKFSLLVEEIMFTLLTKEQMQPHKTDPNKSPLLFGYNRIEQESDMMLSDEEEVSEECFLNKAISKAL